MSTLMIAGGGTGGHIYPAIAIAREYVARDPARRVVFVGTARGLETTIVPKAGFPLELISVGGLKGKGAVDLLKSLVRLPLGFAQAWGLVGRYRPSAALGVGGYASGPLLVAAAMRRVPTIIHEQNAFPGLTNRLLARYADAVAVAFADALPRLKRQDGVVTGNPVRDEFFQVPPLRHPERSEGSPAVGDSSSASRLGTTRRTILIFGGSQGSRVLNDTMMGALLFLAHLRDKIDIVHQTGPKELEKVQAAYRASAFEHARVVAYLDPMAEAMASADLVVSRAGAMTIGELAAAGRPAILVPFAAATNNHQEVNARVVEKAGGAVVLTEAELTPERLASAITAVISDGVRIGQMAAAARSLGDRESTNKIIALIERIQRN